MKQTIKERLTIYKDELAKKLLSPKSFNTYRYKSFTGKAPDFVHPRTWSEKLLWLNHYWQPQIKADCADKYLVRDYIKRKGFEASLIPLIGKWDAASQIDFGTLPQRFAIKCNHGCAMNILVEDKTTLDVGQTKSQLDTWLKTDYSKVAMEMHYTKIKPCIIAEEFLPVKSQSEIVDFKIHCFNGVPRFIGVCYDRDPITRHSKGAIYSTEWKRMLILRDDITSDTFSKPENLSDLLSMAKALSADFPYVRVDLYAIGGRIFFGELTFTPTGNMPVYDYTADADQMIGQWLDISEVQNTTH